MKTPPELAAQGIMTPHEAADIAAYAIGFLSIERMQDAARAKEGQVRNRRTSAKGIRSRDWTLPE